MLHVQKVLECKSQDQGAKGNSDKRSLICRFQLKAGRENCLHKRHPLVYKFGPWHVPPLPRLSHTPPSLVVIYFSSPNPYPTNDVREREGEEYCSCLRLLFSK